MGYSSKIVRKRNFHRRKNTLRKNKRKSKKYVMKKRRLTRRNKKGGVGEADTEDMHERVANARREAMTRYNNAATEAEQHNWTGDAGKNARKAQALLTDISRYNTYLKILDAMSDPLKMKTLNRTLEELNSSEIEKNM